MTRSEFHVLISERVLFLDGAYGTEFFKRGYIKGKEPIEILNVKAPEKVLELQSEYVKAGVDFLLTNTFSGNRHKLKKLGYENYFEQINSEAVRIAKEAAKHSEKKVYILGDMSSVGEMIQPIGDLDSKYVYNIFKEQAKVLIESGVDGIIIETMSDLKELKLAYLAVRDVSEDIPLLVSMTFEENSVAVTGTSLEVYVSLFNDLDVDAIGINCTLTPDKMVPLVKKLSIFSKKPIFAEPNAGKPTLSADGRLIYKTTPEEFTVYIEDYVELGANIVGGCCGTGPDHIRYMTKLIGERKPKARKIEELNVITNRTYMVEVSPFLVIGERINAAAKKKLHAQIKEFNFENVLKLAKDQEKEGAQVLDVNLGLESVLSDEHFRRIIVELDRIVSLPLSLDIQFNEYLEAALFEYPGRAIINSSKAIKEDLDAKINMLKRYGGILIILAMGKEIPNSPEERYKIAKDAVEYAEKNGIERSRIFVDPLVLPLGANQDYNVTLETIKLLNKEGIKTSIGLSNFSFGMPNREQLNASFLALAMHYGLSGAILNTSEVTTVNILSGMKKILKKESTNASVDDVDNDLAKLLLAGDGVNAEKQVMAYLDSMKPIEVAQNVLTKSMEVIGNLYAQNKIFLPHLILAAETVKPIFNKLLSMIEEKDSAKLGRVLLATVEGDIHDIGKKIVATVLESAGFEVIDIGKDVPAKVILEKVKELNPDIVGLSAMMTTTVVQVGEVVKTLRNNGVTVPVIAGGASMNEELAKRFGSLYAKDAQQAVEMCKELVSKT
ncbi:homocysteine S-methyltransferase family protein [Fervidobacterium sp. 2310opik-2]|uniref:homocysteine S-methyltransferase family protein n=1 Tax=Fervidobacterium sp. 2310opik-2 TaxID=1755815 RepID=UPI0013DF6D27|nr:homocysteine S-methyltransferase family protein [Fervidobacterium sp. 2310opik-2]KAF2961701.1 homocysteine methyltransferase [Fervidobacterium sp. 2310opik-2]